MLTNHDAELFFQLRADFGAGQEKHALEAVTKATQSSGN
jgi:hypothetical protein